MDNTELCDKIDKIIKESSMRLTTIHILQKCKPLSDEEHGLALDYIHYLRSYNILRWGANENLHTSEPPYMSCTKYGTHVFANGTTLLKIKKAFFKLYSF